MAIWIDDNMITIIPAAGKSQRFKDAGYKEKKQFLPMPRGGKLIDHVIRDLPENRIIIARKSDMYEWAVFLERVVYVEKSHGPLDTTIQGLSRFLDVCPDQELLIVYSDVIFGGYGQFLHDARSRPCIESSVVFGSDNPRFGYTPNGLMAYAGIFWFASFNDFLTRAAKVNGVEVGIPSILRHNSQTNYYAISENERIDLGTPEDYESYMAICQEVE